MSLFQKILFLAILLQITKAKFKDTITGTSKNIVKRSADSFFADLIPEQVKTTYEKVEHRRRKIKKAFYKFINEAFDDDKNETLRMGGNGELEDIEYSMSTPELIAVHGYRVETHTVATKDGYLLTLQRLLPSKNSSRLGQLVLLHHGLLGSSDNWILLGPNESLPYILLNAGYEVWLMNARGNKYSRMHLAKKYNSPEFWDFSWHEIGMMDLAAAIEFIKENTMSQINFIGHSMGATALVVLLSVYPQYNNMLRLAILLAPLVFMRHVKGPLQSIAKYYSNLSEDKLPLNKDFSRSGRFSPSLIDQFCTGDKKLCNNSLLLLANGGQNIIDMKIKNNVLSHLSAGGSTKTILHYGQLVISGQFQQFDYGQKKNSVTYGTKTPPVYELGNVSTPIAVISSSEDWLSTGPDIEILMKKLPTAFVHHIVKKYHFSHMDFIFNEDAPKLVYSLILDLLE